ENEEENEEESEEEQEEAPKQKTYDFNIDAERIYASFLMDYNLDLFKEQGKLHWKKFMALFSGLSEKTPFMQVVNIRTMEVPKETKHNKKDRQRIQKLKRQYALDKEDKNADDVFEDMITAFGGKGR
ncbi:Bacteriophage Gp15 protein, partial [Virgibacillus subterraneus]